MCLCDTLLVTKIQFKMGSFAKLCAIGGKKLNLKK